MPAKRFEEMRNGTEELLIIFAKPLKRGRVKTRLAATAGEPRALEIYRTLLRHTGGISSTLSCDRQVWFSGPPGETDLWKSPRTAFRIQQGSDLGERMSHAFDTAFEEGYRRVVLIGSDCAELTSGHLRRAFRALHRRDLVIGPAEDGGYYLIGMTKPFPFLFRNIDWSTREVLPATLSAARSLNPELLEELNDIDTESDWNREQRRRSAP